LTFRPASTLLHTVQFCVCCRSLSLHCSGVSRGPVAVAAERDSTEPAVAGVLLLLLLLLLLGQAERGSLYAASAQRRTARRTGT
jgi:hypothetical protein